MEGKTKQPWTEEETLCFVSLWSSAEVQDLLDGASRTKPVFKQIQSGMAGAGYYRTLDQLVNKLKKLKKEYRDQKLQLERSGKTKRTSHFDLMDSVLGDRPDEHNPDLNPATDTTDLRLLVVDDFLVRTTTQDTDLVPVKKEEDAEVPLTCSSPTPSCSTSSSSLHQTKSESTAVSPRTLGCPELHLTENHGREKRGCRPTQEADTDTRKKRKRKRDRTTNLIEYLERSEKRFLEQTTRDQDLTAALLQNVQSMDETTKTLVGLMERMVSVMERQSQK